jgi:FKBP-type peptidyl-prolyl cis-trans isomerase FklB
LKVAEIPLHPVFLGSNQIKLMKKIALIIILLATINVLNAQTTKTPVKLVAAKPVAPLLKNINDSASYAVGVSVANFYKQQGVAKLNTALVSKAINDIMAGKKPLLDDATANNVMNSYMSRLQAEKSKPTIEVGQKFLAKNKLKPGVKTTASGLQYEVIKEGTGIKPTIVDTFVAHYRGTYIDGKEFDASFNRGEPLTYPMTNVIDGWKEGLQLMSVGSKYKFYIPYNIGYGAFDYNGIPGGSMLIFDLELLDVKKKQ